MALIPRCTALSLTGISPVDGDIALVRVIVPILGLTIPPGYQRQHLWPLVTVQSAHEVSSAWPISSGVTSRGPCTAYQP